MSASQSRILQCGRDISARLSYYPRSARQAPHRHDVTQLSFLLAGKMQETLEGRDYNLNGASIGFKPAGSLHEDRWGDEGVLIFTVQLTESAAAGFRTDREPGWRSVRSGVQVAQMVRACFESDEESGSEIIGDVLSVLAGSSSTFARTPAWLSRGRQALADDPALRVGDAARAAGVDRSHFSREFARCYGLLPSLYRKRLLGARAIESIIDGDRPFGRIAHEAGFSDHAHMVRTLRSEIGLTPSRLRRLFGPDIASVQDGSLTPS